VAFQGFVFLKQNDDLIEMYYLKMAKNNPQNKLLCNTCRKNEPEACFRLFSRCGVKPKYVSIESVFGGKDRIEKESMGRCFINGKTFKKAWEGALLMGNRIFSNFTYFKGRIMTAKKFWPSLSVIKKKKCNPYFIVIMITVLIMIGFFGW
jgi:hypothetical protein